MKKLLFDRRKLPFSIFSLTCPGLDENMEKLHGRRNGNFLAGLRERPSHRWLLFSYGHGAEHHLRRYEDHQLLSWRDAHDRNVPDFRLQYILRNRSLSFYTACRLVHVRPWRADTAYTDHTFAWYEELYEPSVPYSRPWYSFPEPCPCDLQP